MQVPYKEGPERDLVNFPRPKRALNSDPVKLGVIPQSWFEFFYPKTGVSGGWMFGTGLLTYLLSKEIWVLEHEFWGGVSFFIMIIYGVKKFGPQVSASLEKQQQVRLKTLKTMIIMYLLFLFNSATFINFNYFYLQEILDGLNAGKNAEIKASHDAIAAEKTAQLQAEGQKMLFDVKRENVSLQLEAVYRERLMEVYQEVKRRLDYQVEKVNVRRKTAYFIFPELCIPSDNEILNS